jgi:hypothetical protein
MIKNVCLSAGMLLCATGAVFAQATAAINGRVVDQGGAVLPGATVTVTETSTGVSRYNQPSGYLGGVGAVSTIPNSFQVQFGGRFSF